MAAQRQIQLGILVFVLGALALPGAKKVGAKQPTDLFISEYVEGSSNNKAIEIYNGTGKTVDLSQYTIQMYFNGDTNPYWTKNLSGSISSNDVFVIAALSAAGAITVTADVTDGGSWFNGDDAVVLRKGGASGTILDVIGQVGFDPGTEWGAGFTSTADNTLRRKSNICTGDTKPDDSFDPAVEWDGYAKDTFGGLGTHIADCDPTVSSTSPVNNTADVPTNTNLEITFSEDVTASDGWFSLTCDNTTYAATYSGSSNHYTLTPATKLPYGKSCTVTIDKAKVADRDGTAQNMPADYSFSFNVVANKVPTISNISKGGIEDSTITFTKDDFSGGFSDGDSDSLTKVKITALSTSGKLQLNGTDIAKDDEILAADLGKLTYIPQTDFNGTDSFSWNGSDGTDFALTDSSMNITIDSINDAPSFTKGSDQEVDENAETQEIEKWATNISSGPQDEASQTLTFEVTNDKNELFDDQPALDAAGKLTYTPKANVSGTIKVTVVLKDDGGTANGGKDTSDAQVFEIKIIPAPTTTPTHTSTPTSTFTSIPANTATDTPTSTFTPSALPSALATSSPLPKITQFSAPSTPSPLSLDTPTTTFANNPTVTLPVPPTNAYLPTAETIFPEPSDLPLVTLTAISFPTAETIIPEPSDLPLATPAEDDLPLPTAETIIPEPSDIPLTTLTAISFPTAETVSPDPSDLPLATPTDDDVLFPTAETVFPKPTKIPLATLTATSLPSAKTGFPDPTLKPKVTHSPTSSLSPSPSTTASSFPTLSPTFQPKPQAEPSLAQFLPFVFKGANESGATEGRGQPDLIGSFTIEPKKQLYQAREPITFTVVITNIGTVATTNGFWADLYLDPSEIPSVNKRWDKLCGQKTCFGIAWQITTSLAPGARLTLTSQSTNYDLTQSFWPGWFAEGTSDLYLLVDSWNLDTATGGIAEGTGEGNNLFHLEGLKVEEVDP